MRAAILLCGQMRRFQDPDVLQSLHRYFALFDSCDVFVSTWSDRGVSYNHGDVKVRGDEGDVITEDLLRRTYPQLRGCRIHSLASWEQGLEGARKTVYTEGFEWSGMKIRGTVVPQLFTLWDACRLWKEYQVATGTVYDVVIRCRPDAVFAPHSRTMYESLAPNTIYAINNRASGTYYPQRIYDIFFFGTPAAMEGLCGAYERFTELVEHPWENGLHKRDACRCLYVQARFHGGAAVQDVALDVCVVKR